MTDYIETIVVSDVKQPLIEDILIIGYIRQSLRPEKGVKGSLREASVTSSKLHNFPSHYLKPSLSTWDESQVIQCRTRLGTLLLVYYLSILKLLWSRINALSATNFMMGKLRFIANQRKSFKLFPQYTSVKGFKNKLFLKWSLLFAFKVL